MNAYTPLSMLGGQKREYYIYSLGLVARGGIPLNTILTWRLVPNHEWRSRWTHFQELVPFKSD